MDAPEQTIEEILHFIEDRPDDAESFQLLGQLYLKENLPDEALAAYERSLLLDPSDPFTHIWLGNWFYRRDDFAEALTWFKRAGELMPNEGIVYRCQGDAYQGLGKFDLAEAAYRRAAALAVDDPETQEILSWKLRWLISHASRNNCAATTITLARRWLEEHPTESWVWEWYGEMLYKMARYDEAIAALNTAIKLASGSSLCVVYGLMGHLFRNRGDYQQAETWYRKVCDENPEDAGGFIFLGAALARQGKLPDAEAVHRRATQCPGGCIDEAWLNLGLVLRGQERFDEAAVCFEKALEITPEYEDAREALDDVKMAMELLAPSPSLIVVDTQPGTLRTRSEVRPGSV